MVSIVLIFCSWRACLDVWFDEGGLGPRAESGLGFLDED